MKTFRTMLKTELKLSLRGVDMFIFAICVPLAVLIILGIIYGDKPAFDGAEYTFMEQSFGALATISICAGGVMGLPLVISDYRSKGILKRYKVTPVSPSMLLAVQVTIYALYAVVSLLLLYLCAALFFACRLRGSFLLFLGGVCPRNRVHIQHWHAGRRHRSQYEDGGGNRQHIILPYAHIFRGDAAVRGHAGGTPESGGHPAVDTGDKAVESCNFGIRGRSYTRPGRHNVGSCPYLYHHFRKMF